MWSNYRPTNRIFKAHELFQYLFYGVYTSVLFNRGSVVPQCSAKHVVGFREVPHFFRGNAFLLQYADASYENFQIIVLHSDYKQASSRKRKLIVVLLCLLFIVVQLRRTSLLHHSCTMWPMHSSQQKKKGPLNFCSSFKSITLGTLFQI